MNNGYMKEEVSRTATIDDVEEETFIALCEFGYKGNYTIILRLATKRKKMIVNLMQRVSTS
jgi:hypothetical protein